MAAATENTNRGVDYWGRHPVEIVDVTWNNGDTFTSEWAAATEAIFMPITQSSFGLTLAGNVVTLVSGGSLTGKLWVFG